MNLLDEEDEEVKSQSEINEEKNSEEIESTPSEDVDYDEYELEQIEELENKKAEIEELREEEIKNNKLDEQEILLIEAQIKNSNEIQTHQMVERVEDLEKIVEEQISNDNENVIFFKKFKKIFFILIKYFYFSSFSMLK